ncbi:MAG TPA: deoxyguanosinetriphosphate triphosphohydrolase [Deltaproteobacteria bacterium]|nr:deoxyguanosinetriphosphate triphosphohydrolase [Deltaproteobacteria bacterium]
MSTTLSAAEREALVLAPWAERSIASRGRRHDESEHPFRSAFQRDRDRIIHSSAFRRLEYKTQVFVYHEGDRYRTRLTHTMEVAQIARTIARALGLNEDLAEAIALAHDLGHPPFGHKGEEILNELMAGHGGFEHNAHSLRIVEHLETRYPRFRGLNLTWEVREGIAKHKSEHDRPETTGEYGADNASLEAQIVDVADEIAYNNHDIDDGLSSAMIEPAALAHIELWSAHHDEVRRLYPDAQPHVLRCQTIVRIINEQVTDLVDTIRKTIEAEKIASPGDIRRRPAPIAGFSPDMERKNRQLKDFLMERLYKHHRVIRMSDKGNRILESLFNAYVREPRLLPPEYLGRIEADGRKERHICDYIAGMTDKFAIEEYKKLFDPEEKV